MEFQSFGRFLIVTGVAAVLFGLGFLFFDKIPFLGRLPGDIRIEKENFRFYIPLTTGLLLSVVISVIVWLINNFRGK